MRARGAGNWLRDTFGENTAARRTCATTEASCLTRCMSPKFLRACGRVGRETRRQDGCPQVGMEHALNAKNDTHYPLALCTVSHHVRAPLRLNLSGILSRMFPLRELFGSQFTACLTLNLAAINGGVTKGRQSHGVVFTKCLLLARVPSTQVNNMWSS